jgi:hypothetical protein
MAAQTEEAHMKRILLSTAVVFAASHANAVDYNFGLSGGGDAMNMTGTLAIPGTGSVTATVPLTGHSDAYRVGGSVNVTGGLSIYGSITEVPGNSNDTGTIGIQGSF